MVCRVSTLVSLLMVMMLVMVVNAQRERGPGKRRVDRNSAGFTGVGQTRTDFRRPPTSQQQHGHGWSGPPRRYPLPYPGRGHRYPPPSPHHHLAAHIQAEKVVLNCVVQGYVAEPVQWLKPDGPGLVAEGGVVLWDRRHFSVQPSSFGSEGGSRLVLVYPQPRHLGTYQCRAGHAASATFTVGAPAGGWRPIYMGRGRSADTAARHVLSEHPQQQSAQEQNGTQTEGEKTREAPAEVDVEEKMKILETIIHDIEEVENAL